MASRDAEIYDDRHGENNASRTDEQYDGDRSDVNSRGNGSIMAEARDDNDDEVVDNNLRNPINVRDTLMSSQYDDGDTIHDADGYDINRSGITDDDVTYRQSSMQDKNGSIKSEISESRKDNIPSYNGTTDDEDDFQEYLDISEGDIPVEEMALHVEEILFTRQFIGSCFRHSSTEPCSRLEGVVRNGIDAPGSIQKTRRERQKLHVTSHADRYWVVGGNKDLFVLRALAQLGLVGEVTVNLVPFSPEWFQQCCTTSNGGADVLLLAPKESCVTQSFAMLHMKKVARRRTSCLTFWLCALLAAVLAISASVCFSIFKTHIRQYACAVDDILCSRSECVCHEDECMCPACVCHCPGVSICAEVPLLDYAAMKWNYYMNQWNANSSVTTDSLLTQ